MLDSVRQCGFVRSQVEAIDPDTTGLLHIYRMVVAVAGLKIKGKPPHLAGVVIFFRQRFLHAHGVILEDVSYAGIALIVPLLISFFLASSVWIISYQPGPVHQVAGGGSFGLLGTKFVR